MADALRISFKAAFLWIGFSNLAAVRASLALFGTGDVRAAFVVLRGVGVVERARLRELPPVASRKPPSLTFKKEGSILQNEVNDKQRQVLGIVACLEGNAEMRRSSRQ